MNINNFENEEMPEKPLHAIFDRQRELMVKYHDIELASGLMQTEDVPVNIHDARGQARLKDFAWRFMEEIGEALDSALIHEDEVHTKEELADALHFFVEMCILSGMGPNDLMVADADFQELWDWAIWEGENQTSIDPLYGVVMHMGMACNTLKNKPWKQSQILTDETRFRVEMGEALYAFLLVCKRYGIEDVGELYNLYFRKSQVNQFRQDSNY